MEGLHEYWFTPQQRAELWERWKNGQCVANCRQRLLAVFGLDDLIVGRNKHVADDPAIIRLVAD